MKKEQYTKAIQELSVKQINFLKALYYSPSHTANAKEVSQRLGYKGFSGANSLIGNIGKTFKKVFPETDPGTYTSQGKERIAYYFLVGEYYPVKGWKMHKNLKLALEELKIVSDNVNDSVDRLPTEFNNFEKVKVTEGKKTTVTVNRYERNPVARQKCIEHYGASCQACDFDFGKVYGREAQGFIEVHHVKPVSEIGKEYVIDPIKDLIPLCSNCHQVVHMYSPVLLVLELKKLIKRT